MKYCLKPIGTQILPAFIAYERKEACSDVCIEASANVRSEREPET